MWLLAVCFAALFIARSASATWRKIYQNPTSSHGFRAGFFIDEKFGVIGGDGADGTFRTTDGGVTWTNTVVAGSPVGNITQIKMLDRLHGWMTLEVDQTIPSLYETTDGALSWQPRSLLHISTDFYINGNIFVVTSRDVIGGSGHLSVDGGKTFSGNLLDSTNGVDFVDNLHGVATGFYSKNWSRTTDGGLTWMQLNPPEKVETWSIYGYKGTSTFYTAGEGDWSKAVGAVSSVFRSVDDGASWSKVSNLPFRTTGHIAGFGEMLYVQAYFHDLTDTKASPFGFYRSTDRGRTWFPIGGPNNVNDTRFVVLGCQGNVVIGFDPTGGVWETNDGGDGLFAQYSFSESPVAVGSVDPCQRRDTTISIHNDGCDTIYLTNVKLPTSPVVTAHDIGGGAPKFPYMVPPGQSVSIGVGVLDSVLGPFSTAVTLVLTRDGIEIDSTFQLTGTVRLSALPLTSGKVVWDSVALCDMRDSIIVITNPACVTAYVTSVQLKTGTNFSIVTGLTNVPIAPGTRDTVRIRFNPTQLKASSDSVIFNVLVQGVSKRIAIAVSGIGKPDNPKLVMNLGTEINFDTVTTCDHPGLGWVITNPGCTYLQMRVDLFDSTLTKPPPANEFLARVIGPSKIHGGDTIKAAMLVFPKVLGYYRGFMRVISQIEDGRPPDTVLFPYKVFVKSNKILSLDDSRRDYDTIQFCDQKDALIPIVNTGCDTLTVSKLDLTGNSFQYVPLFPALPFVIPPGKSANVVLRYLPAVSGRSIGQLVVTTNSDSAKIRTIPLEGYALPTDTITFHALSPNFFVKPGDTALIIVKPSQGYNKKGIKSVTVTLEYNGDVMTPYDYASTYTQVTGATVSMPTEVTINPNIRQLPLNIYGTDLRLDSSQAIIATKFIIAVTDTVKTQFRIASFQINQGDPFFNKCLLGGVSDTGTIGMQFVCGDSQIYRYMRFGSNFAPEDGIAPAGISVHPNPLTAQNGSDLSIPFKALRKVGARLQVIDERGAVAYSEIQDVASAGASSFQFHASQLPSGSYFYRITPVDGGRGVATGDFIIRK